MPVHISGLAGRRAAGRRADGSCLCLLTRNRLPTYAIIGPLRHYFHKHPDSAYVGRRLPESPASSHPHSAGLEGNLDPSGFPEVVAVYLEDPRLIEFNHQRL